MLGWKSAKTGGIKRMSETTGAYDAGASGVMVGLVAGTRVATAMGWRSIEAIATGDKVLTFDAGLQTVMQVTRVPLWSGQTDCPKRFWPLEVPAGALGNRDVMQLPPNQNVMIESDAAEEMYGDPFSLIPAAALDGVNGICRVPPTEGLEVIVLRFADDQVVFGNNGALFFCPSARDLLESAFEKPEEPLYAILPMKEARVLADIIEGEAVVEPYAAPVREMAFA